MKVTLANDVELFYEVIGNGPPLIFLHGNGEDHTIFEELSDALTDHYTCYLVDSRNHGYSSKTESFVYEDLAEDIDLFIQTLELSEVTIFGFSDGAITGKLLAIDQHPELIGLISAGVNLSPNDLTPEWQEWVQKIAEENPGDPMIELMLTEPNISLEDLKKIQIPVFLVAGDDDILTIQQYKEIRQNIPRAGLKIYSNATHMSYIVHTDRMAEDVLEYKEYLFNNTSIDKL